MIKKRMHFYWGNKTMSFLRYMSIHSFTKMNPSWETVLIRRRKPVTHDYRGWNERPDFLHFKGEDCTRMLNELDITIRYLEDDYPELAKMRIPDLHMGDLVQWRVLSEVGGAFSDTDVLFFRPMDHKEFSEADIGLVEFCGNPKPGYIPSTFMLGQPNEFFNQMYDNAIEHGDCTVWDNFGTGMIKRSFGSITEIGKAFPELNVTKLPSRIVFPFAETERLFVEYASLMFYQKVSMPYDSIGIHWYASGEIAQRFNNTITKDNYTKHDNTICKLIGGIL